MYKQLEIQQYLLYTITQVHNLVKTIIQAYYTLRGNTIPFHMIFFSFEIVIHQRNLSRCKKLFSSVSVGGDIFPMLQEETEKKIAFLGVAFSDLGRNLVNLIDLVTLAAVTAALLHGAPTHQEQQNLPQMLNLFSINKDAKKPVVVWILTVGDRWEGVKGEIHIHIFSYFMLTLSAINLYFIIHF